MSLEIDYMSPTLTVEELRQIAKDKPLKIIANKESLTKEYDAVVKKIKIMHKQIDDNNEEDASLTAAVEIAKLKYQEDKKLEVELKQQEEKLLALQHQLNEESKAATERTAEKQVIASKLQNVQGQIATLNDKHLLLVQELANVEQECDTKERELSLKVDELTALEEQFSTEIDQLEKSMELEKSEIYKAMEALKKDMELLDKQSASVRAQTAQLQEMYSNNMVTVLPKEQNELPETSKLITDIIDLQAVLCAKQKAHAALLERHEQFAGQTLHLPYEVLPDQFLVHKFNDEKLLLQDLSNIVKSAELNCIDTTETTLNSDSAKKFMDKLQLEHNARTGKLNKSLFAEYVEYKQEISNMKLINELSQSLLANVPQLNNDESISQLAHIEKNTFNDYTESSSAQYPSRVTPKISDEASANWTSSRAVNIKEIMLTADFDLDQYKLARAKACQEWIDKQLSSNGEGLDLSSTMDTTNDIVASSELQYAI